MRARVTAIPDRPSTVVQDLLLRATFQAGDRGDSAWDAWKSAADLDGHLDLGSFRLLPELARRLRHRGVADPLLDRFTGVSRKHWLANRLFVGALGAVVQALHARAVRVMVPAEAALVLQHYPDYPLDPAAGLAVLVPSEHATTAFAALDPAGWIPEPRVQASLLERYVSARSWHAFRGPADGRLRLQWHVLPQRAHVAVDRDCWSRGTEVRVGAETVVAPDATDQLIQLCARRVWLRRAPLFERAVDVMLLLRTCAGAIDWERLVEESARPGLILPIRETLTYLQQQVGDAVPPPVLARIRAHPVPRLERVDFALSGARAPGTATAVRVWLDYRRSSSKGLLADAVGFPRFLQHYFQLAYLWQVPLRAVARAVATGPEPARATVTAPGAAAAPPAART